MTLIRDNPDQFSRLIDASAERRHLDPGLVEKDYWAVEALRTARIAFDIPIGSEAVHEPLQSIRPHRAILRGHRPAGTTSPR
jgi:hypothetical protein